MPSLDDITRHQTRLGLEDVEWLRLLMADWQIIADLSFADLILWLADAEQKGFWIGAQLRPTTGPTAYLDDLVGGFVPRGKRPMVETAMSEGRIVTEGDPEWREEMPVRVEAIPVRRAGNVIAVITRSTNLRGVRTPSRLELAYLRTASELTTMISRGEFPTPGDRSEVADSLRVGDGFVRTDVTGTVTYASPNAMSAYRRLGWSGDLLGADLATTTAQVVPASERATDAALAAVVAGRVPKEAELESPSASLLLRSIPLQANGQRSGALVLMREVTELRRRERELVSREATIREIHHRVKNNLQTVAALLRLQARRLDSVPGRQALEEAVQRVGSIALVHETLSQTFDEAVEFDEIADRLRTTVVEVSSRSGEVTTARSGSFGVLAAATATPLAMVLTELLQNAVEHAFVDGRGHLDVVVRRTGTHLHLKVSDDGVGFAADADASASLGLSIVSTLVESELGGSLQVGRRPRATTSDEVASRPGTCVSVDVPLTSPSSTKNPVHRGGARDG